MCRLSCVLSMRDKTSQLPRLSPDCSGPNARLHWLTHVHRCTAQMTTLSFGASPAHGQGHLLL